MAKKKLHVQAGRRPELVDPAPLFAIPPAAGRRPEWEDPAPPIAIHPDWGELVDATSHFFSPQKRRDDPEGQRDDPAWAQAGIGRPRPCGELVDGTPWFFMEFVFQKKTR